MCVFLSVDVSAVEKIKQETKAAAREVEQATQQAVMAMLTWGEAQLVLTAATDALVDQSSAAAAQLDPAAIVQAGQAERNAAAYAKVAALLLAQATANRDRLQTDTTTSVPPQRPQSNTTMHSSDSSSVHSDKDEDGDGSEI